MQPTARLAYLPQEPDLSGFATALDYVRRGSASTTTPTRRARMMAELGLGLPPTRRPVRRRSAARGAGAGARARARNPAARRADQPSRPDRHRMAGEASRRLPVGDRAGQPRQAPARGSDAMRRSGSIAARPIGSIVVSAPSRPGGTRGWRRRNWSGTSSTGGSSTKSIGCAMASPRGASATCGVSRELAELRRERREARRSVGSGENGRSGGQAVRRARGRGREDQQIL